MNIVSVSLDATDTDVQVKMHPYRDPQYAGQCWLNLGPLTIHSLTPETAYRLANDILAEVNRLTAQAIPAPLFDEVPT